MVIGLELFFCVLMFEKKNVQFNDLTCGDVTERRLAKFYRQPSGI